MVRVLLIVPLLPAKTINLVQQIGGTLLYYSIVVDPNMITALGSIAAQQSKCTEQTYSDTLWLLKYAATHPNAKIRYTASDTILYIHSDASYLSEPRARSRASGHYFLSDKHPDMTTPPTNRPRLNGPIHSISRIMSNVMGSSAKAEISADYINGQEAVHIRTYSAKWGTHSQPRQSKSKTPPPTALPTTPSSKNDRKRSTCAFIVYVTAQSKVSSSSTGSPESQTWETITPSTIHRRTIS